MLIFALRFLRLCGFILVLQMNNHRKDAKFAKKILSLLSVYSFKMKCGQVYADFCSALSATLRFYFSVANEQSPQRRQVRKENLSLLSFIHSR
jgi:hypothetical protein